MRKIISPLNVGIAILSTYMFMHLYFFQGMMYGDGLEYLSMIVSLCNHFSPELTADDIKQVMYLSGFYNWNLSGFFADFDGKLYSYHFFFYSLLGVLVYIPLSFFDFDIWYVFLFLNYTIMLFVIIYINYCSSLPQQKSI